MDPELKESLDGLAKTNREIIRQNGLWRSFWHGVVTAIGATLGAAIVLTIVGWILNQLGAINFLKPAVDQIKPYVQKQSPRQSLPEVTYESPSPSPLASPTPDLSPESSPEL